jgi:hypothetical protein
MIKSFLFNKRVSHPAVPPQEHIAGHRFASELEDLLASEHSCLVARQSRFGRYHLGRCLDHRRDSQRSIAAALATTMSILP